jgi:hypothetical protein
MVIGAASLWILPALAIIIQVFDRQRIGKPVIEALYVIGDTRQFNIVYVLPIHKPLIPNRGPYTSYAF